MSDERKMLDTRDTLINNLTKERVPADNALEEDLPENLRPAPRFKPGDVVMSALYGKPRVVDNVFWDYEFSGWMCGFRGSYIATHESNYVLASEVDQWIAHIDGLWSWWTREQVPHA